MSMGRMSTGEMADRHTTVTTVIGDLTLVATQAGLSGIYFPNHWVEPERATFGEAVAWESDPLFVTVVHQLREYFAGERTVFDFPTDAHGDAFQERVWAMLRDIPFGETVSYGELAERLGDRSLARMVGQAVGHNPLSIVVPCHRVVGKDGRLTGYAGGIERKVFLLDLEEPAEAKAGKLF